MVKLLSINADTGEIFWRQSVRPAIMKRIQVHLIYRLQRERMLYHYFPMVFGLNITLRRCLFLMVKQANKSIVNK